MQDSKIDLLRGTLDLMVLQTLETTGQLHGYGIARRIEHLGQKSALLKQGNLCISGSPSTV
jgi:PadR family transcriptional regulator PadR